MTSGPARFWFFSRISKVHQNLSTLKFKKLELPAFKHYETFLEGRRDNGEPFSFVAQLQNPHGDWIKNSGTKVWIFRGIKPFRKNSQNSFLTRPSRI
jgi:hypothetical protein